MQMNGVSEHRSEHWNSYTRRLTDSLHDCQRVHAVVDPVEEEAGVCGAQCARPPGGPGRLRRGSQRRSSGRAHAIVPAATTATATAATGASAVTATRAVAAAATTAAITAAIAAAAATAAAAAAEAEDAQLRAAVAA